MQDSQPTAVSPPLLFRLRESCGFSFFFAWGCRGCSFFSLSPCLESYFPFLWFWMNVGHFSIKMTTNGQQTFLKYDFPGSPPSLSALLSAAISWGVLPKVATSQGGQTGGHQRPGLLGCCPRPLERSPPLRCTWHLIF